MSSLDARDPPMSIPLSDHFVHRLRAAFDFPKLFSSFVLVDPIIHRPHTSRPGDRHRMVVDAFTRRDRWSSRCVTPSIE